MPKFDVKVTLEVELNIEAKTASEAADLATQNWDKRIDFYSREFTINVDGEDVYAHRVEADH